MISSGAICQPNKSTLDVLQELVGAGQLTHLDVAAAYATVGGVRDLRRVIAADAGSHWATVPKRWLIAFDYLRSEPLALQSLMEMSSSEVRIYDAGRVLRQLGTPCRPFHPKAFMLGGPDREAVVAGSGNVSRSGLNTGVEAGLMLQVTLPGLPGDEHARQTVARLRSWYAQLWGDATPLTDSLLAEYRSLYDRVENRKRPTPTEDDMLVQSGRNGLTGDDLIKLRVCEHFWIEAGNITHNLGKDRPGNQLMMRRLSRVFFGVPSSNVPQNSPLTKMEIRYGAHAKHDCSLTFSDNGMDKLTLPVPGTEGPEKYDGQNLLFKRVGPGKFTLKLGTSGQKAKWKKQSEAVGASYSMPSKRQWGVF